MFLRSQRRSLHFGLDVAEQETRETLRRLSLRDVGRAAHVVRLGRWSWVRWEEVEVE